MTTAGRRTRTAALVSAAVAVVLVPLAAWPVTRVPAVLTATAVSVLAPLVGVRWHQPARPWPWLAVSAMLACWLVALALARTAPTAGVVVQTLGVAVALGLFGVLFGRHLRRGPAERRRTRRETWGRRTDQLVVAAVVALAIAQSAAAALAPGVPWAVSVAPFDLVLVCLLLRFAATRADLGASMGLLVAGGVAAATYDCLAADGGVRLPGPQTGAGVLWTVAACLFVAGSLHPDMRTAFTGARLGRLRSESARLLGMTPLVLVPVALWLLDEGGRLPTTAYLGTAALVGALAIVRGSQTIRGSEQQARQDPLTGLANRRGLRVAFDDLVADGSPDDVPVGRLALLDLDDFKHVNDTFGHETGDHLLVSVALRLAAAVGERGTVARSGGDEFVLLLPPDGPAVPDLLASALRAPVVLGVGAADRTFPVRCSAGWTELTGASELPLALADADVALYVSKAAARGTATRFATTQREEVLGRLALGSDLRRLVAGEPGVGELLLLFQPLVSLRTRAVQGCEALVRWRHPTRGLLGPDTFLPIAESQGQGAAVDAWVLREACATAAGWPDPLWTVSVNLGRSAMVDPGLAELVRGVLADTGLDPHRLHLEITEHDQLPVGAGVRPLRELAAAGVGVSLDDFGAGYTSVAYLQRYPVSVLKLDRSITGPDAAGALLSGLVGLAGALGITVLAEGVETDEQCTRLARLGIDTGQGWLFGRPVPADRLMRVGNPT
ncbi:diguanylate cyclase (GGDEF) domain-containing protein [Klenkia soli]|uniref:Diguanylate cyclase (GGDEF) domain-containing protein n=1 Tax=Klenkia soli TaxID=1052260 RepID=A0A1H0PY33_9ACTN|nr:bifunctional diguanylate cyclase/phosphodiesterase [Klenkia soli]SDP09944.1 diguanylate cyclase (GGDEF) domain-containing protein [Klenkia soli]